MPYNRTHVGGLLGEERKRAETKCCKTEQNKKPEASWWAEDKHALEAELK